MKIVIPGGSGQVGGILRRALGGEHELVVLSRSGRPLPGARVLRWDGRSLGPWAEAIDGADAVINLAGRSVNCRYTKKNLREMFDSRIDATRVVGAAIEKAARPPKVWLQASSATLYPHSLDTAYDETGPIGGDEPGVPKSWKTSIELILAWEAALAEARTPKTRKVALRTSMVMSPDRGGVFDVLLGLTRAGLGGPIAGGGQFVSWIHEADFVRAIRCLLDREDIQGPVNLGAPAPLPQREFMEVLRATWGGVPLALPATRWMLSIGAFFLRTEPELVLKSRRVLPGRLREAGFSFQYRDWSEACRELVERYKAGERVPAPTT